MLLSSSATEPNPNYGPQESFLSKTKMMDEGTMRDPGWSCRAHGDIGLGPMTMTLESGYDYDVSGSLLWKPRGLDLILRSCVPPAILLQFPVLPRQRQGSIGFITCKLINPPAQTPSLTDPPSVLLDAAC